MSCRECNANNSYDGNRFYFKIHPAKSYCCCSDPKTFHPNTPWQIFFFLRNLYTSLKKIQLILQWRTLRQKKNYVVYNPKFISWNIFEAHRLCVFYFGWTIKISSVHSKYNWTCDRHKCRIFHKRLKFPNLRSPQKHTSVVWWCSNHLNCWINFDYETNWNWSSNIEVFFLEWQTAIVFFSWKIKSTKLMIIALTLKYQVINLFLMLINNRFVR